MEPYVDARWSEIQATFSIVDVEAKDDATPSISGMEGFSQPSQLIDDNENMSVKWATFETDGWPADGSARLWETDLSEYEMGAWSTVSDSVGECHYPTEIIMNFGDYHSSAAFTVCFDNQSNWIPLEFEILVYRDNVLINQGTFNPNRVKYVARINAQNYNKVVFRFTKTRKGCQRVRVAEIIFGVIEDYNRDNITKASLKYQLSVDASSFPSAEFSLTFDNTDHYYNITAPNSVYGFLEKTQPLDVRIGVGTRKEVDLVNGGRFFFTSSKAEDGSATANIIAHDIGYQLSNRFFRNSGSGTWTLSQAVASVIQDSGLEINYLIPTEVGARLINRTVPNNITHRDYLRQAAQAARCTLYVDRENTLVFWEPVVGEPIDLLDNDRMSTPAQVQAPERYNTVEVVVGDNTYTASNPGINEIIQVKQYKNPLVYSGQAVANWLLSLNQNRITYKLLERGNPERKIGDTLTINDNYGESLPAVMTYEQFTYEKGLTAESRAWR